MADADDSEWEQLIQDRVRLIATALHSYPDWENVELRLYSALPHLDFSNPNPSPAPPTSSPSPLSRYIDHTLLKAEATAVEIQSLCAQAFTHSFYSVCVNPHHVPAAVSHLRFIASPAPSPVKVVGVCGFPLGQTSTAVKAFEAAHLREDGADEVDVVLNLSLLLSSSYLPLYFDLRATVDTAHPCPTKVILETAILTPALIVDACILSALAGAAFVKTSTGFHAKGGATVEAVRLMRRVVGWGKMGVKASGGVRDAKTARAMIEAGASRLGTSASVAIVEEEGKATKAEAEDRASY